MTFQQKSCAAVYLEQVGCHDALALDLALTQAHKLILVGALLHDGFTDMHTQWEAVALHAAGCVDGVPQETVAGTLHANHTSVGASTVDSCEERLLIRSVVLDQISFAYL